MRKPRIPKGLENRLKSFKPHHKMDHDRGNVKAGDYHSKRHNWHLDKSEDTFDHAKIVDHEKAASYHYSMLKWHEAI